jgi:ATP-dependent helicase/nuclease subunit B
MISFIDKISEKLIAIHQNELQDVCIVLPNRRAALFFKKSIAKLVQNPIFLPHFISTEEFVFDLSSMTKIDNIELLFTFFDVYQSFGEEEKEDLESFMSWATILLKDFNEIDQYLIPQNQLFSYINEARALEVWNVDGSPISETQQNYLNFWAKFHDWYQQLTQKLIANKKVYQGLAFRWVAEHLNDLYTQNKFQYKHYYFVGFNAFNKSEEEIVDFLVKKELATVYFDADEYYLNDPIQEAGLFLRKHQQKWNKNVHFNIENQLLKSEKNVTIYAANGDVSQVAVAGNILSEYIQQNQLNKTAFVLADEKLLVPALYSLPNELDYINITMGYPIGNSVLHTLWLNIIGLHENAFKYGSKSASGSFHHKDVLRVLHHPYIYHSSFDIIIQDIIKKNRVFISAGYFEQFHSQLPDFYAQLLAFIFKKTDGVVDEIIFMMTKLVVHFKQLWLKNNSEQAKLENAYLFIYKQLIDNLSLLVKKYPFIQSIKTLKQLFFQLAGKETVDFFGEPLLGLQMMGVLETRNLDFENIILLSCNEGVLPAGKNDQSFIPFDIKAKFKLPTHIEKDAIFSYHFYRLIQRAKNIHLIYNSNKESFNSKEKSRYIKQLLYELPHKNKHITIQESVFSPQLTSGIQHEIQIEKNEEILALLKKYLTEKGISPSAFNTYISCPLDFYYKYILGLRENDELEENIEASTFGNVIHQVLENLYQPMVGKVLHEKDIKNMLSEIENQVMLAYKDNHYSDNDLKYGKNLLSLNITKKYIHDFLLQEIHFIKTIEKENKYLTILALEESFDIKFHLNDIDVKFIGKADRIDRVGDTIRILDYKTGRVEVSDLKFKSLEQIFEDKSKSKILQLKLYELMYRTKYPQVKENIEPGIISFRKLSQGVFHIQENDFTLDFNEHIELKLTEMFNSEIPFKHHPNAEYCQYCGV